MFNFSSKDYLSFYNTVKYIQYYIYKYIWKGGSHLLYVLYTFFFFQIYKCTSTTFIVLIMYMDYF